ncbi:MAG: hypothetical protein K2P81_09375 [Bacteriovoracaceae bacterium]|nr:hypothetical protein [Bacteriovoracaceae bacterium]
MYFKSSFVVLIVLASACGAPKQSVQFGKTTKAGLIEMKGEPESTEKPVAKSDLSVLVYEEDQKFQIENDLVVAGFRKPVNDETSLLYWRHKFKNCQTSFQELKKLDNHLRPEKELKCEKTGVSVIYDPNSDQVTRIVEQAHE